MSASVSTQPRGVEARRFSRVLVGFDGSESGRAALEWAVVEAELHDAALMVWTVLEPPPHSASGDIGDERTVLEELEGAATDIAADVAEFRVGRGGAAAVLCEASRASDLLVVGSRGRNPFAGLMLGSVSRACLYHAPCSVAVVRPTPAPGRSHRRVVVGIETSGHARHALQVAAGEARLRGAVLYAIHAVQWEHLGAELIAPTTHQLLTWGRDLVRDELAGSGIAARPVVVNGNPSDVLVRHSRNADLLVLGSRGHNPLATLAVGSTSDYCARHAHCPVLVVRPDGNDTPTTRPPGP